MQDLYTLNSTGQRVFESKEEMNLSIGFPISSGYKSAGTHPGDALQLNTDGTVSLLSDTDVFPIGFAEVPANQRNAVDRVTAYTPFAGILRVKANAGHNAGVELSVTGRDTAADGTYLNTVAAAGSGDWVFAIMLKQTSAASDTINVGVLRTPYKK